MPPPDRSNSLDLLQNLRRLLALLPAMEAIPAHQELVDDCVEEIARVFREYKRRGGLRTH
jgi:hypothetical protein